MCGMSGKRILLVIGGGIAAYKSLELIRELARRGIASRCIVTKGGQEFVTPLSVSALSGEKVFTELFDLDDEADMGHIQLSRDADLLVVAKPRGLPPTFRCPPTWCRTGDRHDLRRRVPGPTAA